MKKDIFLLLGGNKLNFGILRKFQNKGYQVFVVDWNEHPQMLGDRHYRIDVKDADAIIKKLKKDGVFERVAFAYSSIDLAVPSVAKLNKAFGLQTISEEGLKYSSSKSMMTNRWNECGLLNRLSVRYENFNDSILELNKNFKLIIKPDNSASSRGITIVEKGSNFELVKNAFNKAFFEAPDRIVVVEEFVEGTEFTVEMIGDNYGNVCVYGISQKTHTKNTDNNKIAVKLHYNSVNNLLQEKIATYGIKCYKALGFSCSFGHLEVILKEDGTLSPVEIGARSSGAIASDLVDIVSGVDFLEELISVQNGAKVKTGLHFQTEKSAMYYFYDFPEGTELKSERNFMDFLDASISSRFWNRENLVVGTRFSKIDSDNARFGYEILEGPKNIMTPEYIANREATMFLEVLK